MGAPWTSGAPRARGAVDYPRRPSSSSRVRVDASRCARAPRSSHLALTPEENDDISCRVARRPSGAPLLLTRASLAAFPPAPSPRATRRDPPRGRRLEARGRARAERRVRRAVRRLVSHRGLGLQTAASQGARRGRTARGPRGHVHAPRDPGVPRRDQAPRGDRSRREALRARDLERHADQTRRRRRRGKGEARGVHGAAKFQHAERGDGPRRRFGASLKRASSRARSETRRAYRETKRAEAHVAG